MIFKVVQKYKPRFVLRTEIWSTNLGLYKKTRQP